MSALDQTAMDQIEGADRQRQMVGVEFGLVESIEAESALVLDAIQGPDCQDNTVLDVPFNWDATSDLTELKVGYPRAAFEEEIDDDERTPDRVAGLRRIQSNNRAALDVVRGLGVPVVPFDLPDLPASAIGFILGTEAAAAFDAPTLSAALDGMRELPEQSRWPDSLRASRFVPAVEYLQANRLRMRFMEMVHEPVPEQAPDQPPKV